MPDLSRLYDEIYTQGEYSTIEHPLPTNPLTAVSGTVRPNSIAIEGGAFGDEGKGRIVDEVCAMLIQTHGKGIVYRWNGGANAGHTVIVDGQKLALHQFPSGVVAPGSTVILGRGMVIHPGDLVLEIDILMQAVGELPALKIDSMAVLALDTHRVLEYTLRKWATGKHGATGRGISPAYADVLLRHPVRARDLAADDWRERLGKHYDMYNALIRGLDDDLATTEVLRLNSPPLAVGNKFVFLDRLGAQRALLLPYITDVYNFIRDQWADPTMPFIFEGAQGVGLDPRYGVYPDVTSSDPTFSGIMASTEGLIRAEEIAIRAATIKATYMSSVGQRRLPTEMEPAIAERIREDAHEYGTTTRRPRDVAYLDVPCLHFFAQVSRATHLVLTHLDIAYPEESIKVCTHYLDADGNPAGYRPDQAYLDTVTPQYVELPSWDGKMVESVTNLADLPAEARQYIAYVTAALGTEPLFGTTGPERDALISWLPT
ncbi:adenylosuccinate synthetase [Chloroflexota bacterium]